MEDRHLFLHRGPGAGPSTSSALAPSAHVFGVFDGHRGAEAADFCARHFAAALQSRWAEPGATPEGALRGAFRAVDGAFRAADESRRREDAQRGKAARFPGCTAALAVVWGDCLWVANAGDCRTVLCRAGKAVDLSAQEAHSLSHWGAAVICAASGGGGSAERQPRSLRCSGVDHTASNAAEHARIEAAGGTITEHNGVPRVGAAGIQARFSGAS